MSDNGFSRISTRRLPARQRFDYWRSLNALVDIDVPEGKDRADFKADLLHYAGDGATRFGHATNDDTVARFGNSTQEFFLFSLTISGSVELRTENDGCGLVTSASGLAVADSSRQLESRSRGHEHIYLTVPRAEIPERIAMKIAKRDNGLCMLPKAGIVSVLASHMIQTVKESDALSAAAAAAAVKAAKDLALAALELAHAADHALPFGQHDDSVRIAAHRFIDLHLADADLTAGKIATAINCSRAHLYRVFSRREETIGQVIRAARLERASALMIANPSWPISRIAALCGFANPSAFIRMFREQRGMSPAMFRDAARSTAWGGQAESAAARETDGT